MSPNATNMRAFLYCDRIPQTKVVQLVPKLALVAIVGVCEQYPSRKPRGEPISYHLDRDLPFWPKIDFVGDLRRPAPCSVVGPGFGEIELHVDGEMSVLVGERETHCNLTVGCFSCAPRVLTLYPGRMLSLFEKACVVYNPVLDLAMALHFAESVACGVFPNLPIFPRRLGDHPQELAMLRFGFFRVTARPRRHRLHALAVGVSEQAASVARESASSPPIAQEAPNPLQVRMQALFGVGVQRCSERRGLGGGGVERVHAPVGSRRGSGSKFSAKFRRSSARTIGSYAYNYTWCVPRAEPMYSVGNAALSGPRSDLLLSII